MAKKKVAPSAKNNDDESRISGQHFLRALSYATKAAPDGSGSQRLSHLVFHNNRIIASDGKIWLVGILPTYAALDAPFAASKESCETLILGCDFARRMSKARGTSFDVELRQKDGELEAVIHYGARHPIHHPLDSAKVGHIPAEWEEPVAPDAEHSDSMSFDPGYIKMAVEWYKAWDHDHGEVSWSIRGNGGAQRLDMIAGGDQVATAFILPSTWPAATLVHDEPLFEKINKRKVGQSILDLQLSRDGEPAAKELDKIVVDGHVIPCKGLPDPERYVVKGGCVHMPKRPADQPCWQCSRDAIKAALKVEKAKAKARAEEKAEAQAEMHLDDADPDAGDLN
jgi:hypothetical protein